MLPMWSEYNVPNPARRQQQHSLQASSIVCSPSALPARIEGNHSIPGMPYGTMTMAQQLQVGLVGQPSVGSTRPFAMPSLIEANYSRRGPQSSLHSVLALLFELNRKSASSRMMMQNLPSQRAPSVEKVAGSTWLHHFAASEMCGQAMHPYSTIGGGGLYGDRRLPWQTPEIAYDYSRGTTENQDLAFGFHTKQIQMATVAAAAAGVPLLPKIMMRTQRFVQNHQVIRGNTPSNRRTSDNIDINSPRFVSKKHRLRKDRSAPTLKMKKSANSVATKTFPEKLMQALTEHPDKGVFIWLPDGKTFAVVQPERFVDVVLSNVFQNRCKYSSVVRKLHRWGFDRFTSDIGADCFYHCLFQKNNMNHLYLMSCAPKETSKCSGNEGEETNSRVQCTSLEADTKNKIA